MDSADKKTRRLVAFANGVDEKEDALTAAQIAMAYKASLLDFVGGQTSRSNTSEVSRLLSGALLARKQVLAEEHPSTPYF